MPDGNMSAPDVEGDIDFTIHAAVECYCCLEVVQAALARQDDLKGAIAWETPCAPDPESLFVEADLVLVVADKASLSAATARLMEYKALQQAVLLVCLADEPASPDEVPGLVIGRSELAAGLARLVQALVAPVIPQGLVCVDWADTRHILGLDGHALVEEAFGSQPEDLMWRLLDRLRERAAGRSILGMQMSMSCSPDVLKVRLVHALVSACKEAMQEDGTLIVAAPFLDWPESDRIEVRVFAKIGSGAH